jgi:hypothetical protein
MNHVRNSPPSPARRDAAERALYATGDVDTTDRIRAGFGLNLMMIALLNAFVLVFGALLLPGR